MFQAALPALRQLSIAMALSLGAEKRSPRTSANTAFQTTSFTTISSTSQHRTIQLHSVMTSRKSARQNKHQGYVYSFAFICNRIEICFKLTLMLIISSYL